MPANSWSIVEPQERQTRLLFELSGEHPLLPVAELACVGEVIEHHPQLAVGLCTDPRAAGRLAMTHVVSTYLGECEATRPAVDQLLRDLSLSSDSPFAARVKKVAGNRMDCPRVEIERIIGNRISGPVSLEKPKEEFRLIITEDRCFLGRVLLRIDRGAYERRRPGNRDFFHPGVMMPRVARALVNISRIRPAERLVDPFCGTGGILVEGQLLGLDVVGSDYDPLMVAGSRRNVPGAGFFVADSTLLPLKDSCVDAVVTDLPYGQSVTIRAETLGHLYAEALAEIRRVLRPGRRAVVVTHRDIRPLASGILPLEQYFEQRVHKSLTRRICVFRR
jgi:tRNA (guanine10-N2)-dimethyltransferase